MTDDALVQQLAALDLFAGLPDKTLRQIAREGQRRTIAAGTHVTEEGSSVGGWAPFSPEGVCFYLVLQGSAAIDVHGNPRGEVGPGQYFGETSLIDGEPRSATVVAGADGLSVFALSAWAFRPILEENPQAAMAMLKVLAARLRACESRS